METIVKMLIKEHDRARKILREIEETLHQLNMNPKEPRENFEALVKALSLVSLLSEFAELTIKHRNIEEYSVYPKFKDLGYVREVIILEKQHEMIGKLIREITSILNKYRSRKKSIREILSEIIDVYNKVSGTHVKHMEFEEHLFSKIVDHKIKVKEEHYIVI